ncbi:MAG: UrcA family protein [Steroidobacteraceae bacterium]|nr:UrcA family protein [Steroidobacteraceae bacterium]
MSHLRISARANAMHTKLPLAFAMGALALPSARAYANSSDPDQITLSAPVTKVIGHDPVTQAPIERVTVEGRVQTDPATLTTRSGTTLFEDSVLQAAREACDEADPLTPDDGECVRTAMKGAQHEVDSAIARARGHEHP